MNRFKLLIFIFIVALIVIVGGALLVSKTGLFKSSGNSTLPIPLNHPNIRNVSAIYNLSGSIENLTDKTITLKSKQGKLPAFEYNDKTPVYKVGKDNNSTKISLQEFKDKKDKEVIVTARFTYQTKKWDTLRLSVVE